MSLQNLHEALNGLQNYSTWRTGPRRPSSMPEAVPVPGVPFDSERCRSLYERMLPEQQREFWQLRTTPTMKVAFLMRHGSLASVAVGRKSA